jgi:hypothetical protein
MKKLVKILLVIFLTSCGNPPEKPFYVTPPKPKWLEDLILEREKLNITIEKLSSTDSIIVKEGNHELVEIFKKDKNMFLKVYKSKDSVGYALKANKAVERVLERLPPEIFESLMKIAKKDKVRFLEICRNAGIIPNGFEMYFEDYNPYAKGAVEKQKENIRKTALPRGNAN